MQCNHCQHPSFALKTQQQGRRRANSHSESGLTGLTGLKDLSGLAGLKDLSGLAGLATAALHSQHAQVKFHSNSSGEQETSPLLRARGGGSGGRAGYGNI